MDKARHTKDKETRPDTRPPVADGWAGAEKQVSATDNVLTPLFSRFLTHADGQTDGPMDGRTDKASFRVACPQRKTKRKQMNKRNNKKLTQRKRK